MVWVWPPQTSINFRGWSLLSLAISPAIRFASSALRYSSTYFIPIFLLLYQQRVNDVQECMINSCMRFLNARYMIAGGSDTHIYRTGMLHLTTLVSCQSYGQQPLFLRLLKSRQDIR